MDHRAARWFGCYLVLSAMLTGGIGIVLCAWWLDRPLLAVPVPDVRRAEPVREIVLPEPVRHAHPLPAPPHPRLVLPPSLLAVAGEVVTLDGLPLVGARVEAAAESSGDVTFTDARGAFTVAVLAPTCPIERVATLTVTMPGFADARIELPPGELPRVHVTLNSGVRISGSVGAADVPLVLLRAGADRSAPAALELLAGTRSRADGSFAFAPVCPGHDTSLAAPCERHGLFILSTFTATEDVAGLAVRAERCAGGAVPCVLVLDVRDARSDRTMPLEFVTVSLDGERRGALTDAAGHVEIACCAGLHAVGVERPGHEPWQALCSLPAGPILVPLTAASWRRGETARESLDTTSTAWHR
ncbi:MAG: carboxypeptidase-like regulatory domain-containing protein [Planctomycetota bacterium]